MNGKDFLDEYFSRYKKSIFETDVTAKIIEMKDLLLKSKTNNKIIFAGNGASSSISSHAAVDFTKQAGITSVTYNDPVLITAFSNDYGYEFSLQKTFEYYGRRGDVIVLISSSGKSKNMINAAEYVKRMGYNIITFTGFEKNNPLRQMGEINFWVESKAYNIIENTHMIWLLAVCDLIKEETEYLVSETKCT
jgi:D-sedoheptulose 7-phosphate isomerase